jgi:Fe2+ or Zn2+ uptake regulation protein
MTPTIDELTAKLLEKNIKPSVQRIKILEYLIEHRCHPTVDQIFTEVHKKIPTLSKATVYNTLHQFVNANMLRVITIEENETRYEIDLRDHGHFHCKECGLVYDFDIDIEALVPDDELDGYEVTEKNVYYYGICPRCL